MGLFHFTACSFLPIFFGFILFQYVSCDCILPQEEFFDGNIIIIPPLNDTNETVVKDFSILKFECLPNYELIGVEFIQCLNGQWNQEVPFCAIMQCFKPPDVENATYDIKHRVNGVATFGSSAVYKCKSGYELNDQEISTLNCLFNNKSENADWTGELPSCKEKKSCPEPGVPNFGSRRGKCCASGTYLNYSCNDGYELVGNASIQCLRSGDWSSLRPLCKPTDDKRCKMPPPIPHGLVIGLKEGDYFAPEEYALVECEPGYKYKGNNAVQCMEGGVWESDFQECTEVYCDPPPPLENGTILELESTNQTIFPYNFQITYVCDKGYRLIGNSWRKCEENGWSGEVPRCEITRCPDPGMPDHGQRTGNSYTTGSSVRFSCFNGYDLLGSVERYCMPNGQWTGELARCNLPSNYCPNPGTPIKGYKDSTNYNFGSKIRFSCQAGYIQVGSEFRECLSDHTWSGTETKCLGRYDFDNNAVTRDRLRTTIALKAEEQEKELTKYRELKEIQERGIIPTGKVLDNPGRIILYFAFDVSGSVGVRNFNKSIEFAKAIVKKVGISKHGARAGALTFSSNAEHQFLPVDYYTTEEVMDALDKINYTGGGTAASSAFYLIRKQYIPKVEEVLGKINLKSVVFLITDGKLNMGGDSIKQADSLKRNGVEIYCIGITGDVKIDTLYNIASKSKTEKEEGYSNVHILQSYATLSWLVQEITNGTVDYSQCGLGGGNIGNIQAHGKIFKGNFSQEPWPWMATLHLKDNKAIEPKYELKCGGSIIHRNFILTAAHCLYDKLYDDPKLRDKKSILVKLGLTDRMNQSFVQEFDVYKIIIHSKYKPGSFFDYDIALLQLEKSIHYNLYVRPICLPPKDLPEGTTLYNRTATAWAIGFGHDGLVSEYNNLDRLRTTEVLKEIYFPIQSKERCFESWTTGGANASFFTDRMFCAGDGKGRDTCQGDSGGPLMQSLMNSEGYVYWTQIGIVSWGKGCGKQNTYGYYTHVQKLRSWIDETIEKTLNE